MLLDGLGVLCWGVWALRGSGLGGVGVGVRGVGFHAWCCSVTHNPNLQLFSSRAILGRLTRQPTRLCEGHAKLLAGLHVAPFDSTVQCPFGRKVPGTSLFSNWSVELVLKPMPRPRASTSLTRARRSSILLGPLQGGCAPQDPFGLLRAHAPRRNMFSMTSCTSLLIGVDDGGAAQLPLAGAWSLPGRFHIPRTSSG